MISLFSVFTKVISIVVCFAIIFKRVSSSSSVNIRPLKAREVFTLSKNLPASATFFSSCVQRVSKDTSGSKITVTPSFVPLKTHSFHLITYFPLPVVILARTVCIVVFVGV